MTTPDVRSTIDAVWRIESARILGALTRMVGDVDRAEDFAQDALVSALEAWPEAGIPANPGAWLMTVAKRRAIDQLRRRRRLAGKQDELASELELRREGAVRHSEARLDDPVRDDVLRLIFLCCHPVLTTDARVALTLRLAGGLTTEEIARAFLVPGSTLAQRIVRAKRTLREARVPFELPGEEQLAERLSAVLEVIYLIFNEGYAATGGEEWTRPGLCREALRLGRILAGLASEEPEVHGLVSLMELQASRLRARVGPSGEPVLLPDQDRSRWDPLLIRRGLAALERAMTLAAPLGPYGLQAAIAACHARARTAEDTDWERVAALYDALATIAPSPVVELNRAVAVGMAFGPETGLELVDGVAAGGVLDGSHHVPAVRGHLLEMLGRLDEARAEFERAASRTRNEAERTLLCRRAEACATKGTR